MAQEKSRKKNTTATRKRRVKKAPASDASRVKKSLVEILNDVDQTLALLEAHPVSGTLGTSPVIFFDIGDTLLVRDSDVWIWVPAAKSTVSHLVSRGTRLGLISNTPDGSTRSTLAPLFPDKFFDSFQDDLVILSSVVGIKKPDIRIFLHSAAMARSEPSQCVFVGENLAETLAAQKSGMRSLRINSSDDDFAYLRSLT